MLLRLAENLDVPLRERNVLLVAAGYAPAFPKDLLRIPLWESRARRLTLCSPDMSLPALAIDRHWTLIAANKAVPPLLDGADVSLLRPPVNVLRLSLHPAVLAPRIANLADWRAHLIARLRRQIEVTADQVLEELLKELVEYPVPAEKSGGAAQNGENEYAGVIVPFRLITKQGILSFFSVTTIFGTPVDITLSELALESFFSRR